MIPKVQDLAAIAAAITNPAPTGAALAEHDCVRLLVPVSEVGHEFAVGTTSAVVSIYEGGKGYGVELSPPAGNPVVATVLAHQVEQAP